MLREYTRSRIDRQWYHGIAHRWRKFIEDPINGWHELVRSLAFPFKCPDDVSRAAITWQLNAVEDAGAVLAAVITSIPEVPDCGRNWGVRFCWLRDGFRVIDALPFQFNSHTCYENRRPSRSWTPIT